MQLFFSNKFAQALAKAVFGAVLLAVPQQSVLQAQTRQPDLGFVKTALAATKDNWIQFRNYDGRQLIYFTHLVTYKCGLAELLYAVDGEAPATHFPLPPCNAHNPFAIPATAKVYLELPPGGARTVAIKLTFKDMTQSKIHAFKPCDVPDGTTCGIPAAWVGTGGSGG